MKMSTKTAAVFFTVAMLFLTTVSAFALEVPALKGRVNDYANMITPKAERTLADALANFEATDSTQFVVLTVPSLEGDSLEAFSMRVAEAWKIGQKDKDNGALLLVSKADRSMRIEVGYGLEGVLTDVLSGQIVDNIIAPEFKQGRFDDGFLLGIAAMIKAARGEFKGTGVVKQQRRSSGGGLFKVLFLLFFLPIWGLGFLGRHSGRRRTGGGILPWLVLGSMMGSSRSSGGFGSGGLGGGGGFGGFSGGGGGFGGGGASGGW